MPDRDDLVIYELHIGTFAAHGRPAGRLRPGDPAPARTCASSASAPSRSCRRSSSPATCRGATTRPTSSPSSPATAGRMPSSASSRRPTSTGSRSSSTSSTTTSGRRDLDLWRFDGWAERPGRRDLLLQRRAGGHAVGRHAPRLRPRRGPHVPARQRDDLAGGVPAATACASTATVYIRAVDGDPADPEELPDGWSFMAWINDEIRGAPAVEAHDRRGHPGRPDARGAPTGRGRRRVRRPVGRRLHPSGPRRRSTAGDDARSRHGRGRGAAITGEGRGPAADPGHLHRVARRRRQRPASRPRGDRPGDAGSWWSQKRATLGSALVLTSPGIPMLFQGQELLEDRWFDDTVALDWSKAERNSGVLRLHRDLIALRRNADGGVRAGCAATTSRSCAPTTRPRSSPSTAGTDGGPGDDVVVVANFADRRDRRPAASGCRRPGRWRVRFNSDCRDYDRGVRRPRGVRHRRRRPDPRRLAQSALVSVGPYSVVVLSQDP